MFLFRSIKPSPKEPRPNPKCKHKSTVIPDENKEETVRVMTSGKYTEYDMNTIKTGFPDLINIDGDMFITDQGALVVYMRNTSLPIEYYSVSEGIHWTREYNDRRLQINHVSYSCGDKTIFEYDDMNRRISETYTMNESSFDVKHMYDYGKFDELINSVSVTIEHDKD